MHALMYLADDLGTVEAMVTQLHEQQISTRRCHILSKDQDGVARHHLQNMPFLTQTDLLHTGLRGALVGAFAGLVFIGVLAYARPFGIDPAWWALGLAGVLVACFLAWVGGMVGLAHESYKLQPFHGAIEDGKYLVVLKVDSEGKAGRIKNVLSAFHPRARFAADDVAGINPLHGKPDFTVRNKR